MKPNAETAKPAPDVFFQVLPESSVADVMLMSGCDAETAIRMIGIERDKDSEARADERKRVADAVRAGATAMLCRDGALPTDGIIAVGYLEAASLIEGLA